ncbi:MAG: hypothetical protein JWN80_2483 [Microbacteriaceae bacterium]|jgi:hypothetical protein|nr:hypothetical protein [Microbacteriaceae bacterium]
MKKILAILATAFLGIGLATIAIAGPASAHDNAVNASAACNTADGTWTVTWTVANDYGLTETIESSTPAIVPLSTTFGAVGSATATQSFQQKGVTSPQAITLTVGGKWSDGFTTTDSGSITKAQFVGGCSIPKTQVVLGNFTYVDPTCQVPTGSYTVPTTANLTYTPGPGTYTGITAGTTVTVNAAVTDATKYVLTGPASWSHSFPAAPVGCTTIITPVQPTVKVITACNTDGSVTWTDIPGTIHYALTVGDGKSGAYEVTAYAEGNNVFAGNVTSVVVKSGNLGAKTTCVTIPHDPTATDITCVQDINAGTQSKVGGSITVTPITGVQYTITGGTIVAPVVITGTTGAAPIVTTLPAGSYTVTPSALAGFTLTNTAAIPLKIVDNSGLCIPTLAQFTPSVTAISPSCSTATGYIVIDPADGLNYFLGATQLTAAKTPEKPGTYSVLAKVTDPADTIDKRVPNPTTVVISPSTTDCGQLTTLAFTGGNLVGGGFLASSALLFMASGVFLARSRKQKMAS